MALLVEPATFDAQTHAGAEVRAVVNLARIHRALIAIQQHVDGHGAVLLLIERRLHGHQLEIVRIDQPLLQVQHLLGVEVRVFAPGHEILKETFREWRIARETDIAEFVSRAALVTQVHVRAVFVRIHGHAALSGLGIQKSRAPQRGFNHGLAGFVGGVIEPRNLRAAEVLHRRRHAPLVLALAHDFDP